MKYQISIAILAAALAGCATTANYEAMLTTWVGSPEQNLLRSWGPPAQVYESGGVKYLTYNKSRNVFMPGVAPVMTTRVVGNTAYTTQSGGSPAMNLGMACSTTFEITDDRVSSWRYEGNDCKAKPPQ